MNEAKDARKIDDTGKNDRVNGQESKITSAQRGFPTRDYTTPSEARPNTLPHNKMNETDSAPINDSTTKTQVETEDAVAATKGTNSAVKDTTTRTVLPPRSSVMEEKQPAKPAIKVATSTIDSMTSERDTKDKPPAKSLTVPSHDPESKAATQSLPAPSSYNNQTSGSVKHSESVKECVDSTEITAKATEIDKTKIATPAPVQIKSPAVASTTQTTVAAIISAATANPSPHPATNTAANSSAESTREKVSEKEAEDPDAIDPLDAEQIAIRKERAPLTDLYEPYIVPCDTSLADARRRLEIALEQTHKLRQAFTERVYKKYRVCLRPPPPLEKTLNEIRGDPAGQLKRLQDEHDMIRTEKEMEKKEASILNAELRRQPNAPADQADQLMYFTAGLSLVMLQDDASIDPAWWVSYTDGRGPTNEYGHRNKSISAAAATAGGLVIERTKKAAALRIERQRRRQLQLLSGNADGTNRPAMIAPADISSVLQRTDLPTITTTDIKVPTPPKAATTLKQAPATASKPSKSRSTQNVLTANSLLNLHYSADQLDATSHLANKSNSPAISHRLNHVKIAASTSALMARGVGAATPKMMSTQLRLKHPHPESLGGQRRANTWTGSIPNIGGTTDTPDCGPRQQQPFPEAFLKYSLPPLPTVRDRLERKPLEVESPLQASTTRAKDAVRKVLQPFVKPSFSDKDGLKLIDVTKIRVLHNLWKLGNELPLYEELDNETAGATKATGLSEEPDHATPLDPVVAFMVLHSVGLIGRTQRARESSDFEKRLPELGDDVGSDKLASLRMKILQNNEKSFTDYVFAVPVKRKRNEENCNNDNAKKQKIIEQSEPPLTRTEKPEQSSQAQTDADGVPIMSIRGGGEEASSSEDQGPKADEKRNATRGTAEAPAAQTNNAVPPSRFNSTHSNSQSQGQQLESNAASYVAVPGGSLNPNLPGYLTPTERYHHSSALNSLHLAHQLRQGTQFQRQAGDLPYLAGTRHSHEGFDLSFVGQSGLQNTHSQLNALNYARQNQAVAEVRAQIYAREQQAAALLRGAGFSQHGYANANAPHPAFAALLGNTNHAALLNNGQYSLALGGHLGSMPQGVYQPSVRLEAAQSQSQAANASFQTTTEKQTDCRTKIEQQNSAAKGDHSVVPSPSRQKKKQPDAPRSRSTSVDAVDKKANSTAKKNEAVPKAVIEKPIASTKPTEKPKSSLSSHGNSHDTSPQQQTSEATNDSGAKSSPAIPLSKTNQKTNQDEFVSPHTASASKEKVVVSEPPKQPAAGTKPNLKSENKDPSVPHKTGDGMRFVAPPAPVLLSRQDADNVRDGRFHEVVAYSDSKVAQEALTYLVACGGAIPIPRSLVLTPLKERLNVLATGFKTSNSNGVPTIPRDIIAYTILVWLWSNHEIAFRDAFEKSGRIDVDPDCKWLINAAVDTSIRELTSEIAQERATNKGPFSAPSGTTNDASNPGSSFRLDVHTANIVSKALMTELRVLGEADLSTPNYQDLVDYLDEARMCALRGKSQERALLAGLISRKTNMSEAFSHAYTSSMIRAGEALGHDNLLEVVQDESVYVSSMLPYDICADEFGEWEDPCRPETGYAKNTSTMELKRRAHARAMIQKSLKKLQDRNNIRGGVVGQGPLSDQQDDEASVSSKNPSAPTPRGGYKRKWTSFSEPPPPPGTGSAAASSWAAYEPQHFSAPLDWDAEALENLPYGRHDTHERPRSLSLSFGARSGKKAKRSISMSGIRPLTSNRGKGLPRGTCEIPWVEVAGIFQRLELPKKSPPKTSSHHDHHESIPVPAGSVIVAPFCRRIDRELSDTDDSDTEENLSEEHVLVQHAAVLDDMKKKLSAYMEARQRHYEKKRGRASRGT